MDGPGDPKIVEHLWIYMHFYGSGGGLGARAAPESLTIYKFRMHVSPRIIENKWISMHFHGLDGKVKARAASESLKIYKFPCIIVLSVEGWMALAAQGSLKIKRFLCIFMVRVVGLERGRPQNH